MTVNILIPIVEGIAYFLASEFFHFYDILEITKMGVVFLQIVSALYLFIGIIKIKSFVKKSNTEEINICQIAQHFLAFGLYLVSTLVLLYFYFTYYLLKDSSLKALNIAFLCSNILSFISQLCMSWIFWQLSYK
jgi:hypothetical protein